ATPQDAPRHLQPQQRRVLHRVRVHSLPLLDVAPVAGRVRHLDQDVARPRPRLGDLRHPQPLQPARLVHHHRAHPLTPPAEFRVPRSEGLRPARSAPLRGRPRAFRNAALTPSRACYVPSTALRRSSAKCSYGRTGSPSHVTALPIDCMIGSPSSTWSNMSLSGRSTTPTTTRCPHTFHSPLIAPASIAFKAAFASSFQWRRNSAADIESGGCTSARRKYNTCPPP